MESRSRCQQPHRDPGALTATSVDEDFRPPAWLRSPHIQSILPSLDFRRASVERRAAPLIAASKELLLECGDGVRLQSFHSTKGERDRVVVLLHGWEGSSDSMYILTLSQLLFENGFEVVRLNLRDHGATHHLNRELFHSCRLPEVVGAVRAIQQAFPGRRLSLAGFSLGGNFMLRVAAQAEQAGLDIARAIAISPVLDPNDTLDALENGFIAYNRYFIRKWSRSLLKKQAAWPGEYDFAELVRIASLRHMTAELVSRFTEYPTLADYLNGYAITGSRLAKLSVPATLITAADDPIIPIKGLERVARPPALELTVTRRGGHSGFFENLAGPSWVERRILATLTAP
jgi:predicted alpha/beta-fold hydrolase